MKKYNVLVKMEKPCDSCGQFNGYEYKPVRPTHGNPYEFTLQEAEKYVKTYGWKASEDTFKIK